MPISIKIEGLERIIKKTDPAILAKPLREFFKRAAVEVESEARRRAPKNDGRLHAAINHEIDSRALPLYAKVGTNVDYAPYMEYGTGIFAEGLGGKGEHWPPGPALDLWAKRHGFASGYQVAAIIGKRGGLKPRRFFRGAIEAKMGEIRSLVGWLGERIKEEWDRR